MKIVLFTHIDLDGYGCSIILQKLYKGRLEVRYVDYGFDENPDHVALMKEANILLFTDISVSEDTAKFLNDRVINEGLKVIILDHHKSAQERLSHLKYNWIKIDITKSGTLLVYGWFRNYEVVKPYKHFAELVSDYDLWEHKFDKSKLLQFLWSKDREYFVNRFVSNPSTQFSAEENLMIEESIKEYNYSYELASSCIKEFVDCDGLTFGFITDIGLFASLVADRIMKEIPHLDYLVIMSNFKLALSFRSLRTNVREIAEKLNGGGHDLAAGAPYDSNMDIVNSIIQHKVIHYDIGAFLKGNSTEPV